MFAGSRLLLPVSTNCVTLVPKPRRNEGHAVWEPSLLRGIAVLRRSGSRKKRRPLVAARGSGAGAMEEQVERRRLLHSLSDGSHPSSSQEHGSEPSVPPALPLLQHHRLWRFYMTHKNIQRGICGPDGLDLVYVILRGPHRKFSAQGPEFLATALHIQYPSIHINQSILWAHYLMTLLTLGKLPKLFKCSLTDVGGLLWLLEWPILLIF